MLLKIELSKGPIFLLFSGIVVVWISTCPLYCFIGCTVAVYILSYILLIAGHDMGNRQFRIDVNGTDMKERKLYKQLFRIQQEDDSLNAKEKQKDRQFDWNLSLASWGHSIILGLIWIAWSVSYWNWNDLNRTVLNFDL